ncbi:MAG: hypothetical protein GXP35_03445 [Actinobacteria bacterium]|nr:hypothetical protein [Actinomycetota bacterium]
MVNEVEASKTDWSVEATDKFVSLIDSVKIKTTGPALKVVRALVYGLVIAVMATMLLVLLTASLVRFVNAYLPGTVWSTYFLLGSIFAIAGLFLWTKRTQ